MHKNLNTKKQQLEYGVADDSTLINLLMVYDLKFSLLFCYCKVRDTYINIYIIKLLSDSLIRRLNWI